jgi:hypothetical protein
MGQELILKGRDPGLDCLKFRLDDQGQRPPSLAAGLLPCLEGGILIPSPSAGRGGLEFRVVPCRERKDKFDHSSKDKLLKSFKASL